MIRTRFFKSSFLKYNFNFTTNFTLNYIYNYLDGYLSSKETILTFFIFTAFLRGFNIFFLFLPFLGNVTLCTVTLLVGAGVLTAGGLLGSEIFADGFLTAPLYKFKASVSTLLYRAYFLSPLIESLANNALSSLSIAESLSTFKLENRDFWGREGDGSGILRALGD